MRGYTRKFLLPILILGSVAACATVSAKNDITAERTAATELQWVESGFGPQVSPVDGNFFQCQAHHVCEVYSGNGNTTSHPHPRLRGNRTDWGNQTLGARKARE